MTKAIIIRVIFNHAYEKVERDFVFVLAHYVQSLKYLSLVIIKII